MEAAYSVRRQGAGIQEYQDDDCPVESLGFTDLSAYSSAPSIHSLKGFLLLIPKRWLLLVIRVIGMISVILGVLGIGSLSATFSRSSVV